MKLLLSKRVYDVYRHITYLSSDGIGMSMKFW